MQTTSVASSHEQRVTFDPAYLATFERKMFIEGAHATRQLANFFALLLLATVIATFGVIGDSTATVVGAMIVAPLMGPIMALAAAVVMGSAVRAGRALALVAVGVVSVIALAFVLAWIVPEVRVSFSDNAEITSRVAPGLLALLTALASGAAGAYIMAREEIADSIGGVAIAISLVPPLCVVGIALRHAEWHAAFGALTLFLTNFLSILLAGGATFMLGGLGSVANRGDMVKMRSRSFVVIFFATLIVAIPLSLTTYTVIVTSLETRTATAVVDDWLDNTDYQAERVTVQGDNVLVSIAGSGATLDVKSLADDLALALKRPVTVNVRTVTAETKDSGAIAP